MLGGKINFSYFKRLELWDQGSSACFLIATAQLCQWKFYLSGSWGGSRSLIFLPPVCLAVKGGSEGFFLPYVSGSWKKQTFGMCIPGRSETGYLLIIHFKCIQSDYTNFLLVDFIKNLACLLNKSSHLFLNPKWKPNLSRVILKIMY